MNTKLIEWYAIRETLGSAGMGVALFWPAGRADGLVVRLGRPGGDVGLDCGSGLRYLAL